LSKGNKIINLLKKQNRDLLELNKSFIGTMQRPGYVQSNPLNNGTKTKRKLSAKQRAALAAGRKKLQQLRDK
jgi:hypothetical protein